MQKAAEPASRWIRGMRGHEFFNAQFDIRKEEVGSEMDMNVVDPPVVLEEL